MFLNYEGIDAIGCGTNSDAETTVSGDLIEWVNIIFVMEEDHRNKASKNLRHFLKVKGMFV